MTPVYSDLKTKIVLITGGMRGIGRTLSLSLAEQGAHVVFNYRSNPEAAEAFRSELLERGATQATAVCSDVTDTQSAKEKLEGFIAEHGPTTGLVNNAGISKRVKNIAVDHIVPVIPLTGFDSWDNVKTSLEQTDDYQITSVLQGQFRSSTQLARSGKHSRLGRSALLAISTSPRFCDSRIL